jgi:hypothetical protein
LYVGGQVGTWSYFIQYVQDCTHQPEKVAGYFLTGTLGAFGIGGFVSAYLMRFIAPHRLLGTFALFNIVPVTVAVTRPGWVSYSLGAAVGTQKMCSALNIGMKSLSPWPCWGSDAQIQARQEPDGLHLQLPAQAPGKYACAFRIQFGGATQ